MAKIRETVLLFLRSSKTASVDKWKRHRKLIQPTFSQKNLDRFVDRFQEQSKVLVEELDEFVEKGFFDIFPFINKSTMTIACNTMVGNGILSNNDISDYHEKLSISIKLTYERICKVWYHPRIFWNLTKSSKILKEYSSLINDSFAKIVEQKRKEYKFSLKQSQTESECTRDKTKWKGLIDYMMEISEETEQLTNREIVEEAVLLLLAGTDTTATSISYVLLMLALHPEIQEKIYNELISIFGNQNRPVEVPDLTEMIHLERAIKETLRLFPTVPIMSRVFNEDIKLESYVLPKGSSCLLSILETHRDPEIWNDPLKFDPGRFLPEELAKRHPYAFIPFGGGPRNCIGFKFAMMAMKVVLSTLLRSYKFKTIYKNVSDIKLGQVIVLKCADGYNVALEYRN